MTYSQRMPRFLLASLCLHAGLALPWTSAFQFAGHRETVLTVTLGAPDRSTASAPSRTASTKSPRHENETVATMDSSPPAASAHPAEADVTAPLNTSPQDTGATGDGSSFHATSARARIEAQLQLDLQRYFEYPPIARHRGWQGTVWLSYTIRPDGTLEQIEVDRSSGHEILDSATVSAMQRIGRLVEAKQWLDGRSLGMHTQVLYRLTDR